MKAHTSIYILIVLIFISCSLRNDKNNAAEGKLFIIGGGHRSEALMDRLSREAGVYDEGNIVILPMSSSVPDSAIIWSSESFLDQGISQERIKGLNFKADEEPDPEWLDILREAELIYISGGNQNRFMDVVLDTPIMEAIQTAYANGSMVAGTSAGAAVMSEKMITGDELRYDEYKSTFSTIETKNLEIKPGLGLLTTAIIDQHFVWRSRYNRLLTAVVEYPDLLSVGIDESTAILVEGDTAEVIGSSQVLVFQNPDNSSIVQDELYGARKLVLDIYLPGDKFSIR